MSERKVNGHARRGRKAAVTTVFVAMKVSLSKALNVKARKAGIIKAALLRKLAEKAVASK